MQSRTFRSRRRSGRRIGPGTGIGIAESQIQYLRIPLDKTTSQYQPGVTQYRPININISIRINSPGNDGPVSQKNVAVLVTAPVLPTIRIEVPVSPVGQSQSPSGGSETFAPLATLAAMP